ncbi:jg22645 [Pararge aegeria aegeria]|uniref:Jg22645 protein n=1 Tax=Pararge aegeria aegeria TaxID=348720 RepID=A0A8S4R904_9NEOP|nr:jg22645 [Pararge aegeria aegeria]
MTHSSETWSLTMDLIKRLWATRNEDIQVGVPRCWNCDPSAETQWTSNEVSLRAAAHDRVFGNSLQKAYVQ